MGHKTTDDELTPDQLAAKARESRPLTWVQKLIAILTCLLLGYLIALLAIDGVNNKERMDKSDNSELVMNLGSKDLYLDKRNHKFYLLSNGRLDMYDAEIGDCVRHKNTGELFEVIAMSADSDNVVCLDTETGKQETLNKQQLELYAKAREGSHYVQ